MGRSPLTEPGFGSSGMSVDRLKSQVDRLTGKVDGLIDHIKDQDKKIERLQRNQLIPMKIGS